MSPDSSSSYAFGPFLLNPVNRLLLRDGSRVSLTPKAFDTLLLLVEGRGDVLSKEQLMNAIWPDSFVEEANLAQHIATLRKTMGEHLKGSQYIETVPKRGYRFVAAVTIVERETVAAKVERPSLAVLPFKIFGEASDSFLGLSIADTLITKLSRSKQIVVRSAAAVTRFESASSDELEAGLMLAVDFILTGNLYKADERFRVNVKLLRVRDGDVLWTDQVNVTCENVFAVENMIVRRIERSLVPALTGMTKARQDKRATNSGAAYRAYLKGRYFWNKRSGEDLRKGIACFNEAIAIDSNYALAYAGLAASYLQLTNYGSMSSSEGFPLAKAATMKALEIDPDLGEAHASLGYINAVEWDWINCDREMRRSIELNPMDVTARHWYSTLLTIVGRWDQALGELDKAREIDSLSLILGAVTGLTLYLMRRYDEARAELLRTLDLEPSYYPAHLYLARVALLQGRTEEAITEFKKASDMSGDQITIVAELAHAYAMAGRPTESLALLDQLLAEAEKNFVPNYYLALIYAGLRDNDRAFDFLGQACDVKEVQLALWFSREPRFDVLCEDPRYQAVLKRMNLV